MKQPICLFDSGIGGLTVLKKLLDKFPNESYVYLADLANVPFGDKSASEIKEIATGIIEWLQRFNPKLIIMACNASSAVLSNQQSAISNHLKIPIFGMIKSCAKDIADSNYKHLTVWATKLVVEHNAYEKAIKKLNPEIKIEEISCPKLVPMIEGLNFTIDERNKVLNEYLHMMSNDSQALVLGCTHYPLIQEDIKRFTKIKIVDPADALIKDLRRRDIPRNVSTKNECTISLYATAQLEKLERFAKLYLCCDFKISMITLNKINV